MLSRGAFFGEDFLARRTPGDFARRFHDRKIGEAHARARGAWPALTEPSCLPSSLDELRALAPSFARLPADSPRFSPIAPPEIAAYLRREDIHGDPAFARTARIDGVSFWLWIVARDAQAFYVDVSQRGGGRKGAALAVSAREGLSPEQHLAWRYLRRWS